MDQYQAFLARRGVKIQNRACFLENEDVVAMGSDLGRLTARMAAVNGQTKKMLGELQQLENRFQARRQELADKMHAEGRSTREIANSLAMMQRQFDDNVKEKKKELGRCERETAQAFNSATRQMFARAVSRVVPRLSGKLRLSARPL